MKWEAEGILENAEALRVNKKHYLVCIQQFIIEINLNKLILRL